MATVGANLGLIEELAREQQAGAESPKASASVARRLKTLRWWRAVVLGLTAIFFLVPLYAAVRFCVVQASGGISFSVFTGILNQQGFTSAFGLSLRLALVTTLVTLTLVVPTAIYVHLRFPQIRRVMDGLTSLPIVVPPIILIVGVLAIAPAWLKATPYLLSLEYVTLAMPFMYRSLDAGLRAIDHTTLVDASRSLGGGWFTTLFRVLIPNLRSAILSGTVLTVALVIGEYTMASLDQYQTFQVWIYVFDQDNAQVSVAASMMALLVTWVVLLAISYLGSGTKLKQWRAARALAKVRPSVAVAATSGGTR